MATRSNKKPEYPEISASVAGGKGHCLKKTVRFNGKDCHVYFFDSGKVEVWDAKKPGFRIQDKGAIAAAIQSLKGEQANYSFPLVYQQLLGLG